MKIKEKLFYPLIFLVVLLGLLLLGYSVKGQFTKITNSETTSSASPSTNSQEISPTQTEEGLVLVTKVVDGDTIEIEGGQRLRYIGIDTPETVDPREEVQCFGKEASNKNKELVEGKKVRLEKDISETDKYSRLLRYVYIGDILVNEFLVREGYAKASSYPPDVKYQNKFNDAQSFAQSNSKGLWAACGSTQGVQTSESYRLSPLTGSSGCNIKGNISSEKIYHMPGQRYYDQTVIDENKGERWFCSEEEAVKAGWRKSKV